ncbi:hypothetical protein M9Y10_029531 [Tritrichomonas musculus]|uniref:HECT domain-containing protein n=1 Tax=Tritrichomonas musculus TaxID=1915356 RepID=A0ABR2KNA6_9EUKA
MDDRILERIDFDFDIKNHKELTPYVFFAESALDSSTYNSYHSNDVEDTFHQPWISEILNKIKQNIYTERYFGDEKEKIEQYDKSVISLLKHAIDTSNPSSSIENEFCHSIDIIASQQTSLSALTTSLKKKLKRDFRQLAISTARFPHYISQTHNVLPEDADQDSEENIDQNKKDEDENLKKDEEKMKEIISKTNNTENKRQDETNFTFSLNELIEFYDIIKQYRKAFTFSPSFIISTIQKIDFFLASLISTQKNQTQEDYNENNNQKIFNYFRNIKSKSFTDEEKQNHLKYYHISLLIKMRLNMMIQKMHDFIACLLQLIIIEKENPELITKDDNLSFEKVVDESLPDTKTRSTIIKNISSNEIFDFCFGHDERNDFIMTKDGLFQVLNHDKIESQTDLIKYGDKNLKKVDLNSEISEILSKSDKTKVKFTISNGILYFLSLEDKKIHKFLLPVTEKDEKNTEKDEKDAKNDENKNEKESKNNEKKMTNKKLREKAKNDRKRLRKKERNEEEKEEVNLDSIPIEIPDYPIISIGLHDNFFRVIQRKSWNNGKTSLLFTNIDFTPNSRFFFDIEKAFSTSEKVDKIKQTQFEIELNDKSQKYKVCDACFSEDSIFFLYEDSTFDQWSIFNDGQVCRLRSLISPFIIYSNSAVKIDKNNFLYVIEPVLNSEGKTVSVNKFHLPYTKYYLRQENLVFLKYPYLRKLSNIVDNCSHLIVNREVTRNFTSAEYHEIKDRNVFATDDDDKKKKKVTNEEHNPFEFSVTPEEMSSTVQSVNSIASQLEFIEILIQNLNDEILKQFFISLFIKICGINLYYGTVGFYTSKDKMSEITINRFNKFKTFILNLFSSFGTSLTRDFDIIIRESLIVTFSLCGKFIFINNSYNELHKTMNKILSLDIDYTKFMVRSLSSLIFTYPSSLYIIDDTFYKIFLSFNEEINLQSLFANSTLLMLLEIRFSEKVMKEEFINSIASYVSSLFKYIKFLLDDESIPLIEAEEILSGIFGIDETNATFCLMIEKGMISIVKSLHERVSKIPGVTENDCEFVEKNQDVKDFTVTKIHKVIESDHPYNLNPPQIPEDKIKKKTDKQNKNKQKEEKKDENKKIKDEETKEEDEEEMNKNSEDDDDSSSDDDDDNEVTEEIGIINFGSDSDVIYVTFDRRSDIQEGDKISLIVKNDDYNPNEFYEKKNFLFNSIIKYETDQIRVKLTRKIKKSKKTPIPCWGYKINFYGTSLHNPYYWKPDLHLYFYNHFIHILVKNYINAVASTNVTDEESEFKLILHDNIIQGIKLEDIDNYEKHQNKDQEQCLQLTDSNDYISSSNNVSITKRKSLKRMLTRGISRGINYDTDSDTIFDDQFKKSFLNDIITCDEQSTTLGKHLLDVLYSKTAKQNRIKLTKATQSILENEHYLAACLFKQLGLINVAIKFIKSVRMLNDDDTESIEIPSRLKSIMKNVYSLRKTLFFEYQKTKSIQNSNSNTNENSSKYNFTKYSEEIKRKCKLLLYSDPILKFKDNLDNEAIESSTKSIISFVTSKIPLSNISNIINLRRKRLSISSQSVSLLTSFLEQKLLFNSSKPVFANAYDGAHPSSSCEGVTQRELDQFSKEFGELSYLINEELLNNPSVAVIVNQEFLRRTLLSRLDDESRLKSSKLLIDLLNQNKKNDSFIHDRVNFVSILCLLGITIKAKNEELANYIISLLSSEDIDLISKQLILMVIPTFESFVSKSSKFFDLSFALTILTNNANAPIIVRSIFYWLASIITTSGNEDFIKKVFKGIGQSFSGKSCLFIDDSFQQFAHRQVAEGMISFIRILVNEQDAIVQDVIDDILINSITKIHLDNENKDDLMISIGLFASLGQSLSALEPDFNISRYFRIGEAQPLLGYDTTSKQFHGNGIYLKEKFDGYFYNIVLFDPQKYNLTEEEVENLLNLHEIISNSKYFKKEQKFEEEIKDDEISDNILIATFYSFLPIIMQNKYNAGLLLNDSNIEQSLPLFKFVMNLIPSDENSILILSNYLNQAINSNLYKPKSKDEIKYLEKNGAFRFMKMNFGEIIYNQDKNDEIHSDLDKKNLFACSRPIDFECETYFEVKINKIGSKRVFIGFIDSEEYSMNKAVGFGCVGNDGIFCRRSPFLSEKIINVGDKIMKKEQKLQSDDSGSDESSELDLIDIETSEEKESENKEEEEDKKETSKENKENTKVEKVADEKKVKDLSPIKEGDSIGCFYTPEFVYLTINKELTEYRLSHKSLKTYIPLIYIDHDEIALEITENVTKVDTSKDEYQFLCIDDLPTDFFADKDIQKSVQKHEYSSDGDFKEKKHFIGQQVFFRKTIVSENKSKLETIEAFPTALLRYRENYGIIKDIRPFNNSRFVNKMKIESFDVNKLSKEIIEVDVDSRNLEKINTNFFNLIENRTNTKFGINSTFNLDYLPKEYRNMVDINKITNYLKNKTIKNNSKSIAIIMTRYLVFILVDYLRYSKSKLLQDEGINSPEMNVIIKALAKSLPNVTTFKPIFFKPIREDKIYKYIIFPNDKSEINPENEEERTDDEKEKEEKYITKPPGFEKLFNRSFKVFLKKSEKFNSPQFLHKLLHESFETTKEREVEINSSYYYDLIPSQMKIESLYPLPEKFIYKEEIKNNLLESQKVVGFIPVLTSSIPEQFPCAKCDKKRLRQTTDDISYFMQSSSYDDINFKWKYDIPELSKFKFNQGKSFEPEDYQNYKLHYGIFLLKKNLNERLLKGSFGFIQNVFNIIQIINDSDDLYEKHGELLKGEFINNILSLSMKKDPLVSPFIQMIIVSFITKIGFPDSLLSKSETIFGKNSNKLCDLSKFPNYQNELPLLFSIYSKLCQTKVSEDQTVNDSKEKVSSLFDKYYETNSELFKVCNDQIGKKESKYIEGDKVERLSSFFWSIYDDEQKEKKKKKKKNFRSLYLVYYYSILLADEFNLPYPKFLFVHDWMMQRFGGFRKAVSFEDIQLYMKENCKIRFDGNKKSGIEKNIEYRSGVIENEFSLSCSYKQINIYEKVDDESDDNDTDDEDDDDFCSCPSNDDSEEEANENKEEEDKENEDKEKQEENKENDDDIDKDVMKDKKKKMERYIIYIHQFSDDSRIELPSTGESVLVSFPLEIEVFHQKGKSKKLKKLKKGDAFIINFKASEDQQRDCFMQNYDTIQKEFEEFISLSKYDNQLSEQILAAETEAEENQDTTTTTTTNSNTNNNNTGNIDIDTDSGTISDNDDYSDSDNDDSNDNNFDDNDVLSRDDYSAYEIEKIPRKVSVKLPLESLNMRIVALRIWTHSIYRRLIQQITVSYASKADDDDDDIDGTEDVDLFGNDSNDEKVENCFVDQIIKPAYSMTTEAKFKFINQILFNEKKETSQLSIVFNRFEQQKFMEKFTDGDDENGNKKALKTDNISNKARPLFVQFMEQVDEDSISLLKVHRDKPFSVDLVGENSIDSGGPAREIFSSLIVELMNNHIGVFTFNANRRHNNKETNQEDLIPNRQEMNDMNDRDENEVPDEISQFYSKRFIYAGALIAICIVSGLPQPMKLSMIVWEYLTQEKVSIESIYEIDNSFKILMKTAEDLQEKKLNEDEFEKVFLHAFEINDSFDNIIELIPNGSKIRVTKENLDEFIDLAKNKRLHEFDNELKDLKDGFNRIMTHKNITKILRPQELRLLVCGEPNCSIDQMKKLITVTPPLDSKISDEEMKKMFWNVMKSFSPEERMLFIRFSSGNLGLPAPGLKWEENIKVDILSRDSKEKEGKRMVYSHTCFSSIEVPFFENEEELAKMLRIAIKYSGLITDSQENVDQIAEYL